MVFRLWTSTSALSVGESGSLLGYVAMISPSLNFVPFTLLCFPFKIVCTCSVGSRAGIFVAYRSSHRIALLPPS
jgi:hypothetical protein